MTVAGYVWLGIVVVSLIIEFLTLELVSIWISVGALSGLILALLGVGLEWQIVVAVILTLVCILGLRRFCVKYLLKGKEKTNMDIYIGKKEKLKVGLDGEGGGSIVLNGVSWGVKSENGELIKEGSLVEILRLEGNKFVVRRVRPDKNVRAKGNTQEGTTNNVIARSESIDNIDLKSTDNKDKKSTDNVDLKSTDNKDKKSIETKDKKSADSLDLKSTGRTTKSKAKRTKKRQNKR